MGSRPEWRYQLRVCLLVMGEWLSKRLGQIATVWATTVLLGGFVSSLRWIDFWIITALAFSGALRLFGTNSEQKLNLKSHRTRRSVLLRWLLNRRNFHIADGTVVSGVFDWVAYMLQIGSAAASLILSTVRLSNHNFVRVDSSGSRNQWYGICIYYVLVLAEAAIFIPAKLGWELPRPVDDNIIYQMTCDKQMMNTIFSIFDNYFVKLLAAARQNVVQALNMNLRSYVSEIFLAAPPCPSTAKVNACILILDMLHQPGEWIKLKSEADERVLLLPSLFEYILGTSYHEGKEAAISLLISLLVTKTNAPNSKFGPLVLLKALESCPSAASILVSNPCISRKLVFYIERCLQSSNHDEVELILEVVERLPSDFLQGNHIIELMVKQVGHVAIQHTHRHLPALAVLELHKHGHLDKIPAPRRVSVMDVLIKKPRLRELELLVRLDTAGLLIPKHKKKVDIEGFFKEDRFMRCLQWIVAWLSRLDDHSLKQFAAGLKQETKNWIVNYLKERQSSRPDVIKLWQLLKKDQFFQRELQSLAHEC